MCVKSGAKKLIHICVFDALQCTRCDALPLNGSALMYAHVVRSNCCRLSHSYRNTLHLTSEEMFEMHKRKSVFVCELVASSSKKNIQNMCVYKIHMTDKVSDFLIVFIPSCVCAASL